VLNCRSCKNLLADFAEQALEAMDHQAVADHLRACSLCAHLAQTYAKTRQLCRDALKKACPAELAQRLLVALRDKL
jgi:hypothetical protein